ncbi:MAG: TonB-dependent receptor [Bacteroidaceae bacterium]|nr:TonB-dependent receptor [Bacteroidaceae bacterium]
MNIKSRFRKPESVVWTHFTRHGDAIFLSLMREVRIGVLSVATLAVACPDSAAAIMAFSQPSAPTDDDEELTLTLDDAEVVGTLAPLPADKAVRLVQVINRQDIEASSANSVNDLLKLAAGVDVRQRGGFGIQTDIGVNGGTEDQLTVLLNGVNISNPHTGHLTVDLPVSVDDIERIEVIEGGASRVYGCQAFAGAINIVTRTEAVSNLGTHLQGGSYGTFGANAFLALKNTHLNQRLSGGYARSDGGTSNDDFNKGNAYWNGKFRSEHFDATWQAGLSTMNYGANTFYGTGSDSQYEQDRRYLLSARVEYRSKGQGARGKEQGTRGVMHVPVQLYWNRSLDHYVWRRANPQAYQNFHQTNVYGASANAYTTWALGKTAIGLEYRRENILSTRLGKEIPAVDQHKYKVPGHDEHYQYKDGRSNLSLYLEHDILLENLTLSVGMLANHNTSVEGGMHLYPGIDLAWRPNNAWKFFVSFNKSLRTPTYTDIYYNGPGLKGNLRLKPEKSTDWHLGASYTGTFYRLQAKGFYRHGTDMIDWVKYANADYYETANSDIDNIGAEALATIDFARVQGENSLLQRLTLGYCYNYKYRVHQEQDANYVSRMTFLRHKLVASLNLRIVSRLSAQWDFSLKNRSGEFDNAQTGLPQSFGTYATLDLKVQWTAPLYSLYVQANNFANHQYYDFANVLQPGLWLMAGIKVRLN